MDPYRMENSGNNPNFEKRERDNINNYRPITLISHISKILTTIIKNRVNKQFEWNQGMEQAVYRKNYSTIDHIFVINQIIEKAIEYNFEVKILFIDFNKAFDSVNHRYYLWKAMVNQGIEKWAIQTMKNLYENSKAYIKAERKGEEFMIERGVRQGDSLFPNLFNCII